MDGFKDLEHLFVPQPDPEKVKAEKEQAEELARLDREKKAEHSRQARIFLIKSVRPVLNSIGAYLKSKSIQARVYSRGPVDNRRGEGYKFVLPSQEYSYYAHLFYDEESLGWYIKFALPYKKGIFKRKTQGESRFYIEGAAPNLDDLQAGIRDLIKTYLESGDAVYGWDLEQLSDGRGGDSYFDEEDRRKFDEMRGEFFSNLKKDV